MAESRFMEQAIELAKQGEGCTSPNPLVGAVVVKGDRVIGSGYHEIYGGPHAERNALDACQESTQGADLYVTLEPCCHHGKTPPCTEAIIAGGIRRVFVGMLDPNPVVAGKGVQLLQAAGIEVQVGLWEGECRALNPFFLHYIRHKLPYVAMKFAMTLDGKIATVNGESKWITGEAARVHVHRLRNRYSGIMVGSGTIIADDPMLNCRLDGGRNPIRIICDNHLHTPKHARVIRTAREMPTWILTVSRDCSRIAQYSRLGCKIIATDMTPEGDIDLVKAMVQLGQLGVDSILLEGGAQLNFNALKSGIVSKIYAYVAPKIFGGAGAKTPVGGMGIGEISRAVQLVRGRITDFEEDFLVEYEVKTCLQA